MYFCNHSVSEACMAMGGVIAYTVYEMLNIDRLRDVLFGSDRFDVAPDDYDRILHCYSFLDSFARDRVIYGINTGFGPMAQWRVDDENLESLQYNIIRSHATGAGEPLDDVCVRAAMIARVGTFLQARSGVHPDVVGLLVAMINNNVCPYVPRHGSVGASGDLVQLAHIALCMIGEGKVRYRGEWRHTADVFAEIGLKPMAIHIREGLAVTNGTSVMTGIALVNQLYAERLVDHSLVAAVWMNEIAASFDDWMAAPENACRRQKGQQTAAAAMRDIARGSRRLCKREHELYDPSRNSGHYFEHKVQAYYSLRCTPQIIGPVIDTLGVARDVITRELNSACDNPIIDPDTCNVYHGGNFHGDYMSLEQDKMKIAVVRLAMTAERQLNYLFHDRVNGILPPFLNMGTLGLNYGMQACQFTATSTTAECQTLAMPNYVHSIPNNNDNQDIVSMGTNSALLARQVIDNAYQVMAIHFMALAQATDCLGIADDLAPATRAVYDDVRRMVATRIDDSPFYDDIQAVERYLRRIPTNTNSI